MDQNVYLLLCAVILVYIWRRHRNPLHAIPTVGGPSFPLLSYIGAYRFLVRGQTLLQEGYDKYRGSAFKIAMPDQWLVVLSGPELVEEVRKSPDDVLSPAEGVLYITQMSNYVHPDVIKDPYHIELIRDKLTRRLAAVLPNVMDEIVDACAEHIPTSGDAWTTIAGAPAMLNIVARITGRAFVGLPTCKYMILVLSIACDANGALCRDPQYLRAAVTFTLDLVKARTAINMFPEFLKPIVARFLQGPTKNLRAARAILAPVIGQRQGLLHLPEDERPNDMLQWIIEEAHERHEASDTAVTRLQLQNFAAIHTSSNSLLHALYHLLAHPENIPAMRAEIQEVLRDGGWTPAALDKMQKLDSLLKESLRFSGLNILSMFRRALRDVTLPSGAVIPAGTLLSFAAHATHHDENHYEEAGSFDLERFSRKRAGDRGNTARHQFVNTSSEYISFGRGKHGCPGRFFASLELKAILGYLIVHYDMKLAEDGGRPDDVTIGWSILPSRDAYVLFRKRTNV